jgi:hypothetical protein
MGPATGINMPITAMVEVGVYASADLKNKQNENQKFEQEHLFMRHDHGNQPTIHRKTTHIHT